ncbi:CobW family GTP-binding protein [Nitrincola sp. MINF-07-Sa-05]|uniref:CobW family GTP-binding protein n=1 Tax=Nitrincola salilacus TaxID=3400273 RepID=UPI0039184417
MPEKVPTNIITGFLGTGKTTAINHLLQTKPENERWAILVNEFGQVGLDEALIPDQDGLFIKELAGGCVCCALGPALTINLAMLLRRAKPHRLLIEPTGLGHPSGIVDTLKGISFCDVIDLRSIICLLDPGVLEHPQIMAHETFSDQLSLADVIVLNKCDLRPAELVQEAERRSRALFPPKQTVVRTEYGVFPAALLDLVCNEQLEQVFPGQQPAQQQKQAHQKDEHKLHAHSHSHNHSQSHDHSDAHGQTAQIQPQPGQPVNLTGHNDGYYSSGWVFHVNDQFDLKRVTQWLEQVPGAVRIKAALQGSERWISYNRVGSDSSTQSLAWRRDSRIEIISTTEPQLDEQRSALLACLNSVF